MNREKLISLVTKAQCGEAQALDALFTEFYNDVYYFALKTVKDSDTACDITQETFLEIIRTIGNLKEPAAFVTWMKQITYHQCTRYFNKKKDELVEEDEEGNTIFDTLADESEGSIPSEVLEKEEFRQTILAMIDKLTEEQRSAVMMYYFDELTVGQIAQIQGVSEGTVKSRLNYARKAVRKSVEDYEKKTGIKLHSFAFLPLFLLFFGKELMPEAKAAEIHTTVTASANATMAGTVGAASSTATTASASAGVLAKLAQLPLIGKIIAAVLAVALVVGMGALIAKPETKPNQDEPQQSVAGETENADGEAGTTTYESQLLEIYGKSDSYKDIFVDYPNDLLAYIRTTDGRIAYAKDPFADQIYASFEEVQKCCLVGFLPAYYDSDGLLHIILDNVSYPCPDLKGKAVFVGVSQGVDSAGNQKKRMLLVVSWDEEGRLYGSRYDADGLLDSMYNGRQLLLSDVDTGNKIERVEDVALSCSLDSDRLIWRFVAGGMIYEAFSGIQLVGEDICIPVKNTGVQADDLLTDLGCPEMIYKHSTDNAVYIHNQLVAMPEGKTTEQITCAVGGEQVSLIIFDDGTVYLNGLEKEQTILESNEELTALNQSGKIKKVFQTVGRSNTVYIVMADNVTYSIVTNRASESYEQASTTQQEAVAPETAH